MPATPTATGAASAGKSAGSIETATTDPSQNSTAAPVSSGLSTGTAAGIGVGTAVGILAVAALLIPFLLRRRRRRRIPSSDPPPVFYQSKPELSASEAVTAKPQHSSPSAAPEVTLSPYHISSQAVELPAAASSQELGGEAARYRELDSSRLGN